MRQGAEFYRRQAGRQAGSAIGKSVEIENLAKELESLKMGQQASEMDVIPPEPITKGKKNDFEALAKSSPIDMDFTEEGMRKAEEDLRKAEEDLRKAEEDLLARAADDRSANFAVGNDIYAMPDPFEKTQQEIDAENEARKKALELRRQQMELEREYWNQSVDFSRNWSEAWIQSIDEVDAKMAIISTTMRGFEDVTRGVVSTIAKGGKMTVKAVADMVKGVALNIGIEATVQALMNTAKAIAEGVSSWGASPRIEGFATAAASYAATAAVAFSVAGAAGSISRSRGGGKTKTPSANYSERDFADSMAGRHRDQGGSVTVILQGDAESLFKAVVVENDRSMQSGNAAFSMS